MYTLKKLFDEAKKYKKELIYANILALLATVVGALIPLLMPLLVDEVLLKKAGVATHSIDKIFGGQSEAYVYVLCILALGVILRILSFVFGFFQTKLFTIISKNITFKMRQDIIKCLSGVSLSGFEFFGSGKASSLVVVDVDTIDEFLGKTISRFIISVLQFAFVIVILFLISWQLAIFILLVNPFVVFITSKIAKRVSRLKKDQNNAFSIFQDALMRLLSFLCKYAQATKREVFSII